MTERFDSREDVEWEPKAFALGQEARKKGAGQRACPFGRPGSIVTGRSERELEAAKQKAMWGRKSWMAGWADEDMVQMNKDQPSEFEPVTAREHGEHARRCGRGVRDNVYTCGTRVWQDWYRSWRDVDADIGYRWFKYRNDGTTTGHVRLTVFAGRDVDHYQMLGNLTMDREQCVAMLLPHFEEVDVETFIEAGEGAAMEVRLSKGNR